MWTSVERRKNGRQRNKAQNSNDTTIPAHIDFAILSFKLILEGFRKMRLTGKMDLQVRARLIDNILLSVKRCRLITEANIKAFHGESKRCQTQNANESRIELNGASFLWQIVWIEPLLSVDRMTGCLARERHQFIELKTSDQAAPVFTKG